MSNGITFDDLDDAEKGQTIIKASDVMARSRYKDYDEVIDPIVERAKTDEKLAKKIATAADPAEYAYSLGRKEKDGDLDDILADDSQRPKGIDQW